VNDNATGTLTSVAESPFTSVNASDTVATTSFAGYASAGTTVSVTPHISEDDYLRLIYSLTLNSFTGAGAGGVPPPRQTNAIDSEVVVPDGYTVIVGGLKRQDITETVQKIPLLGDIPVLEHLFRNTTLTQVDSALFVFIRPVILRDDLFLDLKYLSEWDLRKAEIPPEMPSSAPMLMR
jgi:general secretion pathway protein D